MELTTDPKVKEVFAKYPDHVLRKMNHLRSLILTAADEINGLDRLEETLKWGEPSFVTKKGSTLRIDWKAKSPDQYAMYFSCSTKLIATFRILFKNELDFEGNRAILFKLKEKVPDEVIKKCVTMALTYHNIKHLPLLGS
tara:strand:+ start:5 stop:424 length:420 start_codon:yes stop_codon:yes gene_type:complete